MAKVKIDISDVEHPARQKAIGIMEFIGEYLGNESIFDCKNGDTKWFDVEDKLTDIINCKNFRV